jgi:hypothetical protein
MSEYKVKLDGREQKVLVAAAEQKDMSPEAVIRQWFRIGQLVDYLQTEGTEPQRLFIRQLFDSVSPGPKKAPTPPFGSQFDTLNICGKSLAYSGAPTEVMPHVHAMPPAQLSCGCDVGCCICNFEKD